MYMHGQAMYELGTYIKCTNYSVYVNVCKSKKSALDRIEPRTSRRDSTLTPLLAAPMQMNTNLKYQSTTKPGGW